MIHSSRFCATLVYALEANFYWTWHNHIAENFRTEQLTAYGWGVQRIIITSVALFIMLLSAVQVQT